MQALGKRRSFGSERIRDPESRLAALDEAEANRVRGFGMKRIPSYSWKVNASFTIRWSL
jgi:hypothetical protein